jgi:hypothetical protein
MYALGVYGYDSMSKPRIYTQRTSVSMRGEHRLEFEKALPPEASLAGSLRDAALRLIGADKLIVSSGRPETRRFWKDADPEDEPPWIFVAVNMTAEQKTVLLEAAKKRALTMSAFLQDALRLELGLPPVTESAKGWKRGARRSKPPVAKSAKRRSKPRS